MAYNKNAAVLWNGSYFVCNAVFFAHNKRITHIKAKKVQKYVFSNTVHCVAHTIIIALFAMHYLHSAAKTWFEAQNCVRSEMPADFQNASQMLFF